jgi:hypothetical protein
VLKPADNVQSDTSNFSFLIDSISTKSAVYFGLVERHQSPSGITSYPACVTHRTISAIIPILVFLPRIQLSSLALRPNQMSANLCRRAYSPIAYNTVIEEYTVGNLSLFSNFAMSSDCRSFYYYSFRNLCGISDNRICRYLSLWID